VGRMRSTTSEVVRFVAVLVSTFSITIRAGGGSKAPTTESTTMVSPDPSTRAMSTSGRTTERPERRLLALSPRRSLAALLFDAKSLLGSVPMTRPVVSEG